MIYKTTIRIISRYVERFSGLNPKISPSGVKGKISVITAIDNVAINRYFPGLLLKNGLLLRITSTIMDAEITDSRNQPVLN
jgi:hypothetical protein